MSGRLNWEVWGFGRLEVWASESGRFGGLGV